MGTDETLRQVQAAYDRGTGARAISHIKENPFDAVSQPAQHSAFENGFADAEEYLSK